MCVVWIVWYLGDWCVVEVEFYVLGFDFVIVGGIGYVVFLCGVVCC